MNTFISLLKSLARFVAKLALALVALGVVAVISYYSYQNYQEKQALAFAMGPGANCSIIAGDYQMCPASDDDGFDVTRKINQENNSQILHSIERNLNGEKIYVTRLHWYEECEEMAVVVTDLEFSDGAQRELICVDFSWATGLTHTYTTSEPITRVSFSYGGFVMDEPFNADITWMERRFTLSNARTNDEIQADRLATAEASAEEERLAAIARAEEERLAAIARAEQERLAIEREDDRLACEALEDEREADFYRRYDNVANNIQITASCNFGGSTSCIPDFTIKNNSRFIILNLMIGHDNIISGACADIITVHNFFVRSDIRPGQTLYQDGSRLYTRDGRKMCTSINNVNLSERRNYPRNSCN